MIRKILILEDDTLTQEKLKSFFLQFEPTQDAEVVVCPSHEQAESLLEAHGVDYCVINLAVRGAPKRGDFLDHLVEKYPHLPILIISPAIDLEAIQRTLGLGVTEYILKPFSQGELAYRVGKQLSLLKSRKPLTSLHRPADGGPPAIVSQDPAFLGELNKLKLLASHPFIDILITGETGTGKELFARYANHLGGKNRPFVAVNCAAIPKELMESIFFGHQKGAFTGAVDSQIGKLELANGGDLFLDEISLMPLDLQAKLLRALELKEFEKVGSANPIRSEFRIIAATNENLETLVRRGLFRADLYYRIAKGEIDIPPLNKRKNDIPALVRYFVHLHARDPDNTEVAPEVFLLLESLDWPGNVRELESVVKSMLVFAQGGTLDLSCLPARFRKKNRAVSTSPTTGKVHLEVYVQQSYESMMESVERDLLGVLIKQFPNQKKMAETIGVPESTLSTKLKKLGL
jgi:DNA-binding NtrC family response regulator